MKAIAIFDMPDVCCECPCFRREEEVDDCYCGMSLEKIDDGIFDDKPKLCPLRPMPQKKKQEVKDFKDIFKSNNDVATIADEMWERISYVSGWNDCLDEILGGTE